MILPIPGGRVSSALSVRANGDKSMPVLLITVSALFLAVIGRAVLDRESSWSSEERARMMQAIAMSVF
jgi:hypothetical protein